MRVVPIIELGSVLSIGVTLVLFLEIVFFYFVVDAQIEQRQFQMERAVDRLSSDVSDSREQNKLVAKALMNELSTLKSDIEKLKDDIIKGNMDGK